MAVPDLRLAICRRCRQPERIASGADSAEALLACAKKLRESSASLHVRGAQCLTCCDGGHTVRVEHHDLEIAFVGVRTERELAELFTELRGAVRGELEGKWRRRVYRIWRDGQLLWHHDHPRSLADVLHDLREPSESTTT